MDFRQAETAIRIMRKHCCGEKSETSGELVEGCFEFGHDQTWISMFRTTDNPELTDDERKELEDADWFFDEEQEAWSHF